MTDIAREKIPSGKKGAQSPRRYLQPSTFWGIRQPIPLSLSIGLIIATLTVPFVTWCLISYGGSVSKLFLPTPTQVVEAAGDMWTNKGLLGDIIASSLRVLAGFTLAAICSIPLGIAMGTFRSMESIIQPIVGTIRYMPVAAFIPLIIIWVGLGETSKVLIVFMGIFFVNVMMIADAVKFVPAEMLNVSYTLGASRRQVLFRVILPAVSPSIMDTFRVNVSGAWNFLVIAELLAADSGLGYRILKAQRFLSTDEIFVGILIIGAIGFCLDLSFKKLSQVMMPWASEARS